MNATIDWSITRAAARATAALAIAAMAGGCGSSATSQFYTLSSTATPDGAAMSDVAIAVGPVTVPAAVDRPQFVVQAAPNRVELDEFHRWAAPLDDGIARAIAGDLRVLLGTQNVATVPVTGFRPTYRVTIDVQRFDTIPGQGVLIDAIWTLHAVSEGISGRTMAMAEVHGSDRESLAAAHSTAIAKISRDIAQAIRTHEHTKRPAARKR